MSTAVLCVLLLSTLTLTSGQLYDNFACLYSDLNLACINDKTISIEGAIYGQYDTCNTDCCTPKPNDCTENVESVNAAELVVIQNMCDNQTSCSYNFGSTETLITCPDLGLAQFIQVFFRCLPEDPTTDPPTTITTTPIPPTQSTSTIRPAPTTPKPGGDSGGLSGGVIAGIVIGLLILVGCIILVAVIVYKLVKKPPPKKRGVKKKPRPPGGSANQRMKVQYDNTAFTSDDHVQIDIVDHKHQNGNIPIGPPVVSDGKRPTKPVSAAESIRYAKEKEDMIRAQYRTVKANNANSSNNTNGGKNYKKKTKKSRENVDNSRASDVDSDYTGLVINKESTTAPDNVYISLSDT